MSPSFSTYSRESYYLFGFPIAHSASPALHNYLFARLGLSRTYRLAQTTRVGARMRAACRSHDFGGASVTMPLKVTVGEMLDSTTDAARHIGAVNTIVPVRDDQGNVRLIGTNTDWLGVRNAILHAWPISPTHPTPPTGAALVIGGGGAARAAVYALLSLHCAPVYLVGRDEHELTALVTQFPEARCVPIKDATQARDVVLAVACVPAVPPVTPAEHAADACSRKILSAHPMTGVPGVFLDMCYKPRVTPLMLHAGRAGWDTVSGIEAMLEQGFAQARMWLTKSIAPDANVDIIPRDVEDGARKLIREMTDIIVKPGDEKVPEDEEEDEKPQSFDGVPYPMARL